MVISMLSSQSSHSRRAQGQSRAPFPPPWAARSRALRVSPPRPEEPAEASSSLPDAAVVLSKSGQVKFRRASAGRNANQISRSTGLTISNPPTQRLRAHVAKWFGELSDPDRNDRGMIRLILTGFGMRRRPASEPPRPRAPPRVICYPCWLSAVCPSEMSAAAPFSRASSFLLALNFGAWVSST